jgi:putative ABC transport system substrate-binding protein
MFELVRQLRRNAGRIRIRDSRALRPRISLLAACLLMSAFDCQAGSYLLVKSGNGDIYTRFENSLNVALANVNKNNTLIARDINAFRSQPDKPGMQKYDAIVSAGIEASIAVSNSHTGTPTLMSMLPQESYNKLSASGDITCKAKNCRVIFLDQPVTRQLRLLKLALPTAKQIAVISSSDSSQLLNEIAQTAVKYGLNINSIHVTDEDSVLTALNRDLASSDVLMAIPDPVVYNRNTARAILLSTFHQHIPLFAYSSSFVRAGATLGIYSTPEDIARHVADLLSQESKNTASSQGLYPKYFTIDVNQRAADALGITLPDAELLVKRLKVNENE